MSKRAAVITPQVGDIADHKTRGLDPREVARVSEDGKRVWLNFFGGEGGPYPASNYTFTRPIEDEAP